MIFYRLKITVLFACILCFATNAQAQLKNLQASLEVEDSYFSIRNKSNKNLSISYQILRLEENSTNTVNEGKTFLGCILKNETLQKAKGVYSNGNLDKTLLNIIQQDNVLYEVLQNNDLLLDIIQQDNVLYDIIQQDNVLYDIIQQDNVLYDIIQQDNVLYDIIQQDNVLYDIIQQDNVLYDIIQQDNVLYDVGDVSITLVKDDIVSMPKKKRTTIDIEEALITEAGTYILVINVLKNNGNHKMNLEQESSPKKEINAYPNPVQDRVNIELPNDGSDTFDLILTDTQGSIVYTETTVSNKQFHQLYRKNISSGIYLLTVKGATETYTTKLIFE